MAGGDSKQFERAMHNWNALHDQSAYSVPQEVGRTAILCSYITSDLIIANSTDSCARPNKEIRIFRQEAFNIADALAEEGIDAEVILNASADNFREVLRDPSFSDVMTIGHGLMNRVFIKNPGYGNVFDWKDVAAQSDHLKQGSFVQRHCGGFGARLAVPYGAFAMSDHRNVWAPVGQGFSPRGLRHRHNEALMSVSKGRHVTYKDVTDHAPF